VNLETLRKEIVFKAVRSGGAGGQHVNKVSTKVVLYFDLEKSKAFESEIKELLIQKLQSKISQDGLIILSSDETRSQFKNKAAVWQKLILLVENQLKINKPRKETKIPRSVIEKRLKAKKINAQYKQNRRKNDY
jgi:ribosome-associated protein